MQSLWAACSDRALSANQRLLALPDSRPADSLLPPNFNALDLDAGIALHLERVYRLLLLQLWADLSKSSEHFPTYIDRVGAGVATPRLLSLLYATISSNVVIRPPPTLGPGFLSLICQSNS